MNRLRILSKSWAPLLPEPGKGEVYTLDKTYRGIGLTSIVDRSWIWSSPSLVGIWKPGMDQACYQENFEEILKIWNRKFSP